MPVTKLIVGGFRSLAETIEIPLAPITVLLGPNSAGKSAVKDAMLAMKAAMSKAARMACFFVFIVVKGIKKRVVIH